MWDCPWGQGTCLGCSSGLLRELDLRCTQFKEGEPVLFGNCSHLSVATERSKGRFAAHIRPVSTWFTLRNLLIPRDLGLTTPGPESKQCLLSTISLPNTLVLFLMLRWDTPRMTDDTIICYFQEKCSCVKHKIVWILIHFPTFQLKKKILAMINL